MGGKRFRVALSFTGEQRDFVAQVAALLAQRFGEGAILYDRFHRAEFSRADLALHLGDLYEQHADLVVAVLCPDYEHKDWCGLEWNAILGLLKQRKVGEVMLTRFDRVEGRGLRGLAGYLDLDGMTPQATCDEILERLALNENLPADHYRRPPAGTAGARTEPAIPSNLPRQAFFFGRDDELRQIAGALGPDTRSWGVLIDGPGGIGKTALAIRAASLVPAGRFKGIVFLSAKERELTADGQRALGSFVLPNALEMFNAIAREIDRAELTQAPEARRSEDLLRTLRGMDLLLVLDNLETLPVSDRDQLFTFLNRLPPGCSAIVTSRRRSDSGAVSLRLDRLDDTAALQMLEALTREWPELARSSESERRQLVEQTGGNPLLMRWVAGQLGRGRLRDLPAALALLRSPEAANNPLQFVFGDLLDTFTTAETQVLAALTHFTLPASVNHLAEASQLNVEAAQGALSALASRALVVPDREERQFVIVPLVAEFLRRSRPEAIADTGRRLAQRGYVLVIENGHKEHTSFGVLEDQWPAIAAAIPLLLGDSYERSRTTCDAVIDFMEYTGRWDEALTLSRDAESLSQAAKLPHSAGWWAYKSGYLHHLRGDAEALMACADRAAGHWQTAGRREQAMLRRLRGIGHYLRGNWALAQEAFETALSINRSLNVSGSDLAMSLNDVAAVQQQCKQFEAAKKNFEEAVATAQASGSLWDIATYTSNLANLAIDREQWGEAKDRARTALALAETPGDQDLLAATCCHLSRAVLHQGQPEAGRLFAQRAVDIYERLRSPNIDHARQVLAACIAYRSTDGAPPSELPETVHDSDRTPLHRRRRP
jgi:tetratricopeptide (TPR) repeat protein